MPTLLTSTAITAVQLKESASPGTPSSGYGRVYAYTDGTLHYIDDAGLDVSVSALYTGKIALASQAIGDLIYASSTSQFGRIADVATGQVLVSGGVGVVPAWSATPTITGTNITGIPWAGVSKSGSSLADLATRAVANLSDGSNVALLNGIQTFTAANTFSARINFGEHIIGSMSGGYAQFAGSGGTFWGLGSTGGASTPGTGSTTFGLHHYNGSAWSNPFSVSAAGLLTVSGFGTHSFSAGGTGFNRFDLRNPTAGSGNGAQINVGNDTDAQSGQFISLSSTYTTAGDLAASGVAVRANYAGGLSLSATHASGDVRLYSRNALAVTLGASQAVRMHAYGAGTATFDASGNISSVSDERYKDRIAPLGYGLQEVLGLSPVRHGYNELSGLDRDGVYGGFLAQNVSTVMPLAVGLTPSGYLTLSDRPILGAAVTAIQELHARIAALEAAAA